MIVPFYMSSDITNDRRACFIVGQWFAKSSVGDVIYDKIVIIKNNVLFYLVHPYVRDTRFKQANCLYECHMKIFTQL